MVEINGIIRPVAAALLALLLAGCGSMSPGRLYDKAADVFAGPADTSQPTPNLASVPARPAPPSLSERQQVSAGLVSDRNNAQYSEQVLRNPLAPPPPPPAAPAATDQPVTANPPGALPPADPSIPQGAPVVRLVNGQIVASPGFFATEPPPKSAPPAAVAAAPTTNLAPGPVPPAAPQVASGPDIVPDAPPPPPFELPRPAAPTRPPAPAVAALPPPAVAPAPARQPAPAPIEPSQAAPRPASAPPGGAIAVIYFGDGKSALDAPAQHVLGQVADIYRLHGGTVRVIGYSGGPGRGGDPVKSSLASLNLASARADAVADGLVGLGLRRETIERSASGDAPPMIDEGRNTGVAGTRRAEIWLDY